MMEVGHVGMEDSSCGHVGMEGGSGNPVVFLRVSPPLTHHHFSINQHTIDQLS